MRMIPPNPPTTPPTIAPTGMLDSAAAAMMDATEPAVGEALDETVARGVGVIVGTLGASEIPRRDVPEGTV